MAGDGSRKRKAPAGDHGDGFNRKGKKQWRRLPHAAGASIEAGDSGIWATCAMGREGKAVPELRDTFDQYCKKLYGVSGNGTAEEGGDGSDDDDDDDDDDDEKEGDIEAEIKKEIEGIRKPTQEPLFRHVRIDTDCIMFFKTRAPIEPVEFVRRICEDAMAATSSAGPKASGRFVKRLTPMTLMGKATEEGLQDVATKVVAPHFHGPDKAGKKFAIRPNVRNHKTLSRDTIIRTVAAAVGPGHSVDLKNYDVLILVDMYKARLANKCGISVVGEEFERLKRFNLAEIYEPSPKEQPKEAEA